MRARPKPGLLLVATRELRWMQRDGVALVLVLLVPVLAFAILTLTFSNAVQLREAAAITPAGQLLAETDAPFLTPVPNRGKSNSPAQVAHTIRALAAIKELGVAELCAILQATGQRVFGPW